MISRFDFAVVGAPKAATTSLVDYLRAHPDIFLPAQKEVPWFVHDDAFAQGVAYLEPFYATRRAERVVGIAHVHMLRSRKFAERLHAHSPQARIVAVLRDPVERAYSAYWHMRKLGWEDALTFEEALAREPERLKDSAWADRSDFGYVRDGEYAPQLEGYRELFGVDNVRVLLTDDLANNPHDAVAGLVQWLGLPLRLEQMDFAKRSNEAARPRSEFLHWLLARPYGAKQLYKRLVPLKVQYLLRRGLKEPIMQRNLTRATYPPMSPQTRERLSRHFRPLNQRLSSMIGRELPAWI